MKLPHLARHLAITRMPSLTRIGCETVFLTLNLYLGGLIHVCVFDCHTNLNLMFLQVLAKCSNCLNKGALLLKLNGAVMFFFNCY